MSENRSNIVELEINRKNRLVYFSKYRWVAHIGYWIWVLCVGTLFRPNIEITPSVILNHFVLDNLLIACFFYIYCLYIIPYYFKRNKNLQFWAIVLAAYLLIPALDVYFNKYFVHLSTAGHSRSGFLASYLGNLGNYLLNFMIFSMMLFFMEKNEESHTNIELEKEKQEIEQVKLDMLKTNISPDFLMRSLSQLKIAASNQDQNTPESILTFSDLLRYRLYSKRKQCTSLKEELDALNSFIHFIGLNNQQTNLKINFELQGNIENKSIAPLAIINVVEPFCKATSNKLVVLNMVLLVDDTEITLEMDYGLRANPLLLADLQEYGNSYHQLYQGSVKFHFENCEDDRCVISLTLPVLPSQDN
ncbi:MAG: histidine kinase [Bacteroidota bacterium]